MPVKRLLTILSLGHNCPHKAVKNNLTKPDISHACVRVKKQVEQRGFL